jgi:hypothetical protein
MREEGAEAVDGWLHMVAKLSNIQRDIATDVWPNGAALKCGKCGWSQEINTMQAGYYLKTGWPRHCDRTMACHQPSS